MEDDQTIQELSREAKNVGEVAKAMHQGGTEPEKVAAHLTKGFDNLPDDVKKALTARWSQSANPKKSRNTRPKPPKRK